MKNLFRVAPLVSAIVLLSAANLCAEIMHTPGNGATNEEYLALGNQSRFQASGFVRRFNSTQTQDGFGGSMTLIDPHWAIASAHQFYSGGQTFAPTLFGFGPVAGDSNQEQWGVTAQPGQLFIHPGYIENDVGFGSQSIDLALIYIPNAVTGIQPARLYSGPMTSWGETFNISQTTQIYHVGYGVSGYPDQPTFSDRMRRGSRDYLNRNAYTNGSGSHFATRFSPPGDSRYDYYSAHIQPGDSGSSAYVDVNGEMQLVGVWTSGTIGQGYGNTSYGLDLRPHHQWIQQTMASIPEPSTYVLCVVVVLLIPVIRHRRAA